MVAPLILDSLIHEDHIDPIWSMDFGDPNTKTSDGNTVNYQGTLRPQGIDTRYGVQVKFNDVVTCPISNPKFQDIYTDRIRSCTVAILWSNYDVSSLTGDARGEGNWQLKCTEPDDPQFLVMSMNPKPDTLPKLNFVFKKTNGEYIFVAYENTHRIQPDAAFHWYVTHLDFNHGTMQMSADGITYPSHLSYIAKVPSWTGLPVDMSQIVLPIRKDTKPVSFVLRKGTPAFWVKRVRIFVNLSESDPLKAAWENIKDLH